ncbi:sigma-70 family RNA polymerase sigma factor [Pseudomonas sp. MF4836]|uniref:sigma-70 family RNA polymerase sigma factor n=1 Tax=Pseudomonas sp. MF4836 TaxID=1960827 RepID=UPI00099809BF|nr:sigma-70 family RNA polymerase sigma factor [Pseudomonas sp. MF4836]OOV95684.1 RNA polymerase subunit sigma [Pseudomonas sp. MF4836]
MSSGASPPEAPQSITSLYCDHHGWLVRWLRMRLGCSHQAADMAQDTFVRLLLSERKGPATPLLQKPRYYLATIARRVMVDSFRRRALEQAYLQALAQQPEAYALSPEDKLLMVEALHAVDAMLDGLGRKVKQAFLLSQLQGMGYKEIAAKLGVSVSSITQYVAKASEHCLLFALESEL